MAWIKLSWVEKVTRATEPTMNNIELGIEEAKTAAAAAQSSGTEALGKVVIERGEVTLSGTPGKAEVTAAKATASSIIIVSPLSGTAIAVGVTERKAGSFKIEATGVSTDKVAWAIVG
jgi:osmotically-inducible protein OsmY